MEISMVTSGFRLPERNATQTPIKTGHAFLSIENKAFARDVTAAILVSQNNLKAAILVSQTNPIGL